MAAIIAAFREALWFHDKKAPCIDSWTFILFNKVTAGLFVLGSVMVSGRQFFGEPIRCDAGAVRRSLSSILSSCHMGRSVSRTSFFLQGLLS